MEELEMEELEKFHLPADIVVISSCVTTKPYGLPKKQYKNCV